MVQEKPHAPISDYTIGVPWGGCKSFLGPDLPPVEGKGVLPTLYDFWLPGCSQLGSLARCSIAALRFVTPLTASLRHLFLFYFLMTLGKESCMCWLRRLLRTVWYLQTGKAEVVWISVKERLQSWWEHIKLSLPPPPPPPCVPSASGSLPCTLYPLAALKIYLNSLVFASPVCLLFMLKVSWKI